MLDASHLPGALRRLNQARLLAAGLLVVIGALLILWNVLSWPFLPFAFCLASAAAASGAFLLGQPRVADLRRFAWLQLAFDTALATAIVGITGGAQSLFAFLYVLVVTAACLILGRLGGLVIAGMSSLLYTGLVVGPALLPSGMAGGIGETTALEILSIFLNAATFLMVAILTGSLAERYHALNRALEEQKRDLSDLRAFKDLIFESVGSGLVGMDLGRRITAMNRAAEEITGFESGEARGRTWESIFGDGIPPDDIQSALRTEGWQVRRHESRLMRRDGRMVPLGTSFWPIRSGLGEPVGIIGVFQDLSSVKQMEERVRQADRLATIGRLATNIAHEIRNPLASLSGAIEVLTRELPSDAGRDRLVQVVLRESDRLNRIVKEFLEYARPAPLLRLPVNVGELLDEVLLLLEHRDLPAGLKLTREYDAGVSASLDPQQFRQAVWNLCINGLEAMPNGGELRIGARAVTGGGLPTLEVWVADSGNGIDPQSLPHIFEPFFSTKPEGSGLGLALVHRIIQDHGGEIEVRSGPDTGTTVTLRLPLAGSGEGRGGAGR